MKKMLSILAASSLIVSAPIAVISCKKEEYIQRVDYNYLINDFVAETALIFQSHIYEAFRDYNWMSDKQLPPGITMDEIRDNVNDLSDPSSSFYKKVSSEIYKIIPLAEINKYLIENVSSNINYSPIIIDKGTPLKNGVRIESMQGDIKGANFTLFIGITTDVFYLDSNGLKSSQQVPTYVSMNILEVPDVLKAGEKINERFNEVLYGEQANKYIFKSDKGGLENTAVRLEKEGVVEGEIVDLINGIDLTTGIEKVLEPEILINNLRTKVNHNTILDASRFETIDNQKFIEYGEQLKQYQTALKAMSGIPVSEETYFNSIKSDDYQQGPIFTDWNIGENDEYTENLQKAINKDPGISKSINPYNLDANFNDSPLKYALDSNNSRFKLNMQDDKTTIALFGVNISGVGFKLDGQYYDFPNGMVCYRQKTNFPSTKELYDAFISDAFNFQREFYNLRGRVVPEDPSDMNLLYARYFIELPDSGVRSHYEEDASEDFYNEIFTFNKTATYYAERFDLTSKMVIPYSNTSPTIRFISWDTNNLHLYNSYFTGLNNCHVNTYFFSSGWKYQKKVKFYFPNHRYSDILPSDKSEREAFLKRAWSPFNFIE